MTPSPLPTETLAACPICGGSLSAPFLQEADHYLNPLSLCRCTQCGMVCLNPRLTPQSVEAVENASTVYDYSPEQREATIRDPLMPLTQWIAHYGRSGGKRWLDVGCNRGLLLEAARRNGWDVVGIEIASEAAGRARADYGLTVLPGFADLAGQPPFDVISVWHVLEHTFNPLDFVNQAKQFLAPGGVLAIQVPAFECLDEYRARGQQGGLLCAVHNFYFTAASMRNVLERSGLHILLLDTNVEHLLLTAIVTNMPPQRSWRERMRGWLPSTDGLRRTE